MFFLVGTPRDAMMGVGGSSQGIAGQQAGELLRVLGHQLQLHMPRSRAQLPGRSASTQGRSCVWLQHAPDKKKKGEPPLGGREGAIKVSSR